ncbi:ferritin-like domain-containing protein [Hymenobacter guriensis]|uniref:PA2169 family four-helix-bundle protein n=1 Tax=Hymenobacter guriensis TaxID=2793065 RepID=A0ABS0L4D7_9BACT|nr:PA2169 family four-helix-bundle protein [Hymenobacter guriensis]MBG8554944.1 PA2169 family four-helix-bundle protein [Hymenobacter guriensis]
MAQHTSSTTSQPDNGLLDQAQNWFRQGNLGQTLGQVPSSLKNVSTKGVASFNKLSTTQKVVGGALLALGVGYLATRKSSSGPKKADPATTLQELLLFVNDRIAGYERAVAESQDAELRGYYKQLVSQSQQFANDLNAHLARVGGQREDETTLKGKVYRAWMDAKAAVTGSDEKAILGSNVYGEEWALKAYEDALRDQTLNSPVRQAIQRQYFLSQKTYKHLKSLEKKQQ